jgi:acetyl esterase/lipase/photosystem II stability/assembly factor-like uncharacterized protein
MNTNRILQIVAFSLLIVLTVTLIGCGKQADNDTNGPNEEPGGVEVDIDLVTEREVLLPGECSIIEWHVQGGFTVSLNGEQVDFGGQKSVCPETTTAYIISVDAGDRLEQAEVVIQIEGGSGDGTDEGEEPSAPQPQSGELTTFEVSRQDDIVFGTYSSAGQSHNLLLDLYLPTVPDGELIPLIIYIHGGGWFEGSKETCPGNTFASRGYAVACVNYRLAANDNCSADYTFPVQVHDVKAAVRWLRTNGESYGLDTNKIAVMGESSGGHLAALLGTSHGVQTLEGNQNLGASDAVQAVVDWYGPVDIINGPQVFSDDACTTSFDTLNQTYGGEETQYFYWTLAWSYFLGGSLDDALVLDRARTATPLTHIDPSDPPFLVMHGEEDGMVPIDQSEALAEGLKSSGVEVTFIRVPGAGHGYGSPEDEVSDNFLSPTLNFLNQHLGKVSAAPQAGQSESSGQSTTPSTTGLPAYQAQTWTRLGGPPGGLGYDIRMQPDNPDIMYVTDAHAGIHKSVDGGLTWFPANTGIDAQNMSGSIPVFCLTIDPHEYDTVWAGTQLNAHLYRSTDAGQTWESRDNGIPVNGRSIRGITIDPNNPNIIYAGLEVSSIEWNGSQLTQTFDVTKGEVYKSTDAGLSWTRIWEGNNLARYIWVDPRNSNRLYVSTGIFDRNAADSNESEGIGGGEGVLRSDDGGQTWTVLNEANGLNGRYIPSLFMHPEDPDTLIAATSYLSAELGVWATYDGGDSWQKVMESDLSMEAVEIATSDTNVWYAAGENIFFRSDDTGQTWQTFRLGPPDRMAGIPIDIQVDPRDPYRVFVNNYHGGNLISEDGGETWEDASEGYTGLKVVSDVDVAPDDPKLVFAGGFRSNDGGQTWVGIDADMGDAFAFYPLPNSSSYGVIATDQPGDIYHSTDHGATWQQGQIVNLMDEAQAGRAYADVLVSRSIAMAPSDPSRGYVGFAMGACTQGGMTNEHCDKPSAGFYRTNDTGHTWEEISTPFYGVATLSIAIHPDNPDLLFVGTANGLFRSDDGGSSWQIVPGISIDLSQWADPDINMENEKAIVYDLIFDPFDSSTIYAAVVPGGVWRSTDGGQTWQQISAGMDPNEPIYEIVADSNRNGVLYVSSGASGAFYTTDGGQTWLKISDGLTHMNVHGLGLSSDGSVLYAGTIGSGVFRLGTP